MACAHWELSRLSPARIVVIEDPVSYRNIERYPDLPLRGTKIIILSRDVLGVMSSLQLMSETAPNVTEARHYSVSYLVALRARKRCACDLAI